MKTRLAAGVGAAVLSFSFAGAAHADERYAAYVMDARTSEVLLSDHADEQRYPASLTKMMTLYLLFDAVKHGQLGMETRLTASRHAASQPPSRLGLQCSRRHGCDSITVEQAIRGIVVQSANDVAMMVGERLGGSEPHFVAMMNAKARDLGMTNTHFVNPNGLPNPNQYSSAHDLAMLSQALWRDFPQYYHYFQTAGFTYRNRYATNHDHLLGQVDGVDGIKTGYTRASGYNLATSAERNGRRVIVVVMGGESASARDAQVAYLVDGAFETFAQRELNPGVTFANLPVNRLDVQLNPNAGGGVLASTRPASPLSGPLANGALAQGQVVQTMNPVGQPLGQQPVAQGDQDDNSTDEGEDAPAANAAANGHAQH
jgi:D-alanyl-D-alanine carboxypeptidase